MKITMRMTMDGLVRALRWHGHVLRESHSGNLRRPSEVDRQGRWKDVMRSRDRREAANELGGE